MKDEILDILGVEYTHTKTSDGGDIYITKYGIPWAENLKVENWYQEDWFNQNSKRLLGTSNVFHVNTKEVNGKTLQLVVKNCRVGEDVPVDTYVLQKFVNAEFNSPWEEFSLVEELRAIPPSDNLKQILTQNPLAIYVPPERLQLWQTGRSRTKINKINRRHPGIDLDILRQYKLIYQWIDGLDLVELFEKIGLKDDKLDEKLSSITTKVLQDLEDHEFSMADMKAVHVIIPESVTKPTLEEFNNSQDKFKATSIIEKTVSDGLYSIIDYELLLRTPKHEERVKSDRRHSYLDIQRDRFVQAPLPDYLVETKIMGVPYVHGRAESTGGLLWVVGRNASLFDYFLPERWRKTPNKHLSKVHEVYYTKTKDDIHVVWRTSRVGENPNPEIDSELFVQSKRGFNSPFEEFAIATKLEELGIPCVYVRAIYMTGSTKLEPVSDFSRFESHKDLLAIDGEPILRPDRNYISIRGFYNGPDSWVAEQDNSALYIPIDLVQAIEMEVFSEEKAFSIFSKVKQQLHNVGFCGDFLSLNNILIARRPDGVIILNPEGQPQARISNFESIYKL